MPRQILWLRTFLEAKGLVMDQPIPLDNETVIDSLNSCISHLEHGDPTDLEILKHQLIFLDFTNKRETMLHRINDAAMKAARRKQMT